MIESVTSTGAAILRERFAVARANGKRAKDAAEAMGISEGEAVAAHCGEHDYPPKAVPLNGLWLDLLQTLERCNCELLNTAHRIVN